jgi:nicotinamidase-related amidase
MGIWMVLQAGTSDALLIVDPQVDFCPGGALAVPSGDRIFSAVNRATAHFEHIIASRDWHPPGHVSFQERGGAWPVHCLAGSPGATFHPSLQTERVEHVVSKGTEPDREAYSAFDGTGLAGWLREKGVKRLFIAGLATDYCVRASALDARQGGFGVVVLEDAVAAVDVNEGDGERALAEMREAGAAVARSEELRDA